MLPEVGELVFSFVIGYMGALEFLYVVRHLYHWGFRHHPEMRDYKSEAESLRKLQDQLKTAIAEAKEREAMGLKAMQDGVMYKDGFRIDEDQKKIEELKEKVRIQEQIAERQREIEEELKRQQKIEEETKQQLKKAEEELKRIEEEKRREKQKAEEEKRKAEEEKRKAEEARKKAEDDKRKAEEEEIKRQQKLEEEENMRKIFEAEKRKEEEQRRLEEEKENQRKLLQAEKEREEKQRQLELEAEKARIAEQLENERKLLEAERQREEKQRELEREEELRREREENELKLLQAEREREEQQRQQEIEDEKVVQKLLEAERERERAEQEQTAKLLEAERQQEIERQQRELDEEEERENIIKLMAAEREAIEKQRELEENEENMRNLLKAERELELKKQEMEEEAANLQKLIEAEKQMEERQRQVDEEALQKLKTAQEEMELRQTFDPNAEAEEEAFIKKEIGQAEASIPQTVKTQYGQTSLKPKSLLFPGISEESSSAEPASSLQSSFSTQISSEAVQPSDLHFDEYERQAPDGGEDMPSLQYSDDYLRSLDGIKNKPLVREDGSGRRRAFKKRRSSGSSTSSRESRASREEELKMFTSLEEEEFENIRKGDSEYDAIKYASEPNLKVTKQHRRHKRSPAKDAKRDPNDKSSLEMLDEEESSNPWGEVKPESYKNTDFWKREKRLSIDEEQEEFDAKQRIQSPSTAAVNIPKMSSFEEATKSQHEEAISALKRQMSKDPEPIQEPTEDDDDDNATKSDTKNLIFSGEYTKAMNKDWHSGHFCCWQCDESLTGQRYVIRDDHPYCIKCYENVFANTCEECSKIIGIDSKDLSYKDKHWHEACFLCNKCRISLVDKQFGAKADKIYCGNCYDAQFASRCDGCGEVFRAGTKKMEYKTRQWHEKCFCCCVCKTPIGTKSFIPREQEIYCAGCYEEKFATRCIKCNKVITAGGVTYKNEPWHRECFTCTNCNITLAGQRFTSRDEKPYCADCFGELFAKRCTACVKPITGIGGTRFISFEDRHWHHDCFICASCKTSLVGRGFITDGPDIICPECAKQKLI